MRKGFEKILSSFIHFIYPLTCLHCKTRLFDQDQPYCENCLALLQIIDSRERCPYCFSLDYDPKQNICYPCFMEKPPFKKFAAVFDYEGPAASLISKLKYGNQPFLAKGAGAYMAYQFLQLEWPKPDLIVPIPLTFTHQLSRGYNQSLLLAEELGKLLDIPVKSILKRKFGDYSQAGLSFKQRTALAENTFSLKEKNSIQDLTILLIDDVVTTGTTLKLAAEALQEGFPSHIYGMTLCKA